MPKAEFHIEIKPIVVEFLVNARREIIGENKAPVLLIRMHSDEMRPRADGGGDGCLARDIPAVFQAQVRAEFPVVFVLRGKMHPDQLRLQVDEKVVVLAFQQVGKIVVEQQLVGLVFAAFLQCFVDDGDAEVEACGAGGLGGGF